MCPVSFRVKFPCCLHCEIAYVGDLACDVPCLVYCAPETRYMMGGKRQYTAYLVMVTLIAPYRVKVTYQNGNKVVTEERIDPQVCTHASNAYLLASLSQRREGSSPLGTAFVIPDFTSGDRAYAQRWRSVASLSIKAY